MTTGMDRFTLAIEAAPGVEDHALTAARRRVIDAVVGAGAPPTVGVRRWRLLRGPPGVDRAQLQSFADAVVDPIAERGAVWEEAAPATCGAAFVHVALHAGLTDDEGDAAGRAFAWISGAAPPAPGFGAEELWAFDAPLSPAALAAAAQAIANTNVHRVVFGALPQALAPRAQVRLRGSGEVEVLPLGQLDDEGLRALSAARALGLSVTELRAIQAWVADPAVQAQRAAHGLGALTDCELEVFAQTWSEHCKHKEFAALIDIDDEERGGQRQLDGLFKQTIRGPTLDILGELQARGQEWVVTVFSDNAGVVRVDEELNLTLKVETHNSPSALDPYGGAITGILGCNRDAVGTGCGGGRLLFNTDVLCFGRPDHAEALLPGQLHPARVMEGVHAGVADGGNKSGVPTLGGALLFDTRFSGKPLVFCGSAALVPRTLGGRPSHLKDVQPGYRVVTAGGRVGRDGIHGATFSSHELVEGQSGGVVQIGSPFIQKKLFDFLEEAAAAGLVAAVNDSGAGGLSSSVGELARLSGGVRLDTDQVPLKVPGLRPWEIFVSESQERMSLAVRPADLPALRALAAQRDVELADIGEFTADGLLSVWHGQTPVCALDMEFLHEGVPRLRLSARVEAPVVTPNPPLPSDLGPTLCAVLSHPDVCSREAFVRAYDHEVKGKTVLKPYSGAGGRAPQDAGVIRLRAGARRAVGVSHGIAPHYGDLDPYAMGQGVVDEAIRGLISVGARLPVHGAGPLDAFAGCDNFCVPDSVVDPVKNPDGREKLGKLVRIAEGMADAVRAFGVPLISGKDSMKNDLRSGGRKISVPPTLLVTMAAVLPDGDRVVSSEWKAEGDVIFLIGQTEDELGRSALLRTLGLEGGRAPRLRLDAAVARYGRMAEAHAHGLLRSSHDLSDGGLAVALAECCIGAGLGAVLATPPGAEGLGWWFSESHSRFVVSVAPAHAAGIEALFGADATRLGQVGGAALVVDGAPVASVEALRQAYERPLLAGEA
jgi:phosphoribosylformylglycinamidine synthase II